MHISAALFARPTSRQDPSLVMRAAAFRQQFGGLAGPPGETAGPSTG